MSKKWRKCIVIECLVQGFKKWAKSGGIIKPTRARRPQRTAPKLRLSGRTPLPKFLCCSSSFLRLWCREGGALEALTFLPVVLVWNHQSSQTFQGSHTLRIFTIDLKFLGCFLGFSHCLKHCSRLQKRALKMAHKVGLFSLFKVFQSSLQNTDMV